MKRERFPRVIPAGSGMGSGDMFLIESDSSTWSVMVAPVNPIAKVSTKVWIFGCMGAAACRRDGHRVGISRSHVVGQRHDWVNEPIQCIDTGTDANVELQLVAVAAGPKEVKGIRGSRRVSGTGRCCQLGEARAYERPSLGRSGVVETETICRYNKRFHGSFLFVERGQSTAPPSKFGQVCV